MPGTATNAPRRSRNATIGAPFAKPAITAELTDWPIAGKVRVDAAEAAGRDPQPRVLAGQPGADHADLAVRAERERGACRRGGHGAEALGSASSPTSRTEWLPGSMYATLSAR